MSLVQYVQCGAEKPAGASVAYSAFVHTATPARPSEVRLLLRMPKFQPISAAAWIGKIDEQMDA